MGKPKTDRTEKAKRIATAIKYQKANNELRAGNYEAYNMEVAKVIDNGST